MADRNLMLAQRLAPDDVRRQFEPYRPDVLPDGSPMPGAGEDATKVWGQMAHNLAQPTDWGGIGSEYANALLMGSTAPGMRGGPGFRAFHGSPHSFDRFSNDAIGSGEGAQAYGYGHYFGEAEETGKYYRDALSGKVDLNAGKLGEGSPTDFGHMYEVNINADPEHFLHWDKPLSQQSQHVQDALAKHGITSAKGSDPMGSEVMQQMGNWAYDNPGTPGDGKGVYGDLSARSAQRLQELGIPGVKYLDQVSRPEGEGSHNFVVFNPDTIEILRKYGLAGLGLGTAAAAAQPDAAQ